MCGDETCSPSPAPFYWPGGEHGILLVHGFTGSPAELRLLGQFLHRQGFTVHAPLLAGHGTTPQEMCATNREDWWQSVVDGYRRLQTDCAEVVAIGLSMGGLLALKLAALYPLSAVVAMAAPVYLYDRRAPLAPLFHRFYPFAKRVGEVDPYLAPHLWSYDQTPVICVPELLRLMREVRALLPRITVPALVLQGLRDRTVRPKSAQVIYDRLGSPNKSIHWYARSQHILPLDREREEVFQHILQFIRQHIGLH